MPDAALAFSIAGDGYLVESDDPTLLAELTRWTQPLRGDAGNDAVRIQLRTRGANAPCLALSGGQCLRYDDAEDLVPALEGLLYDRLQRPARALTVLHAAVAARAGRAVLFLGESGTGKSVLSLRLAQRGWTYLSDDLAPVDGEGKVLAVPRPVAFAADEINGALWSELSQGCVCWEATYRTPEGDVRTTLYASPARAAESGASFAIAAAYRLEARRERAPRLHRLPGPEARAWIFALGAMARADAGEPADAIAGL